MPPVGPFERTEPELAAAVAEEVTVELVVELVVVLEDERVYVLYPNFCQSRVQSTVEECSQ
jgi:hypothetical protein